MKIQMLVLANSKKAGGRCLAGINTQTLELIRPVTEQLHYEIPAIYTLNKKTNNQIRPLDLIEIELIEPKPLKYQRENWLCRPETIAILDTFKIENFYTKLIPEIESATWFLKDSSVKVDPVDYKNYKTDAPSLALIKVEKAKLFHKNQKSRRIAFRYAKTNWDLPFTDDFYDRRDSELSESLLCLSIGEEWKSDWDTSNKTWHYKLVAGLIELPTLSNSVSVRSKLYEDSLLSICGRLFHFIPDVMEIRQKPIRFASKGWVYQNGVSILCPECNGQSIQVFRKHLKKFGRDLHYWGIVCTLCKNAKDSKDFSKDFIKAINFELEYSKPIKNSCLVCVSNVKNF